MNIDDGIHTMVVVGLGHVVASVGVGGMGDFHPAGPAVGRADDDLHPG